MRRLLVVLLAVVLIAAGGAGLWFWSYLTTVHAGRDEVVVAIPRGAGVRGIGSILAARGLLEDDIRFLAYVHFAGLTTRLKAGEYSIPPGLTPPEVLQLLATGATLRHQVTVPEGLRLEQVAEIFARGGWVERDRFLTLARDPGFIAGLGITVEHLEGYLFPETYTLLRQETDAASVLRLMVAQFEREWAKIRPAQPGPMSRHQLVTLASIVEKETGVAEERPLIARVFLNRLARSMRLQSDPTVIYGLVDFSGNLTRNHLRQATPYNTYVIPALPPGPICSPGRAALEAVLRPAESNALYFVSKNDGSHVFSTNLADHNRAVRAYQKTR